MGKKTGGGSGAENIKVLVRCRPLSEKENIHGYKSCVDLDLADHTVTVRSVVGEPDRWTFDAVINNTFSQRDIFSQFIMPLVDSVLEGFNATVFAYGQSGSGKTHTMTGKIGDREYEGITPRCFTHVFDFIKNAQQSSPNRNYSLYVSFIELYNGKVQDLLAKQQVPLAVKENKDKTFYVQGAHIPQVKCVDDIFHHMEEGTERRRVASTDLNADSSRSHSVFSLVIECTEIGEDGDSRSVTSKLNLVDLAGSERQGKTGASGDTLKEGCNINLSLSALGTVIDTIVKGRGHVPFRSSPLTMLLKDSLGGSSKTVMFANIGPSEHNFSETVSTLRFADRAKQIKNKPVVNMDTKDQKIVELSELVHELREKLKKYETEGVDSLEKEMEELRERVGELEVSLDNAVKGREADLVDFENGKAKLNMERQNLTARVVELEEQISQLQSDLQIAESSVADERSQREEIFRLCNQYLRDEDESAPEAGGRPITKIDELDTVLRDRAHGKHNAELVHLRSTVQQMELEATQTRAEQKAVVKEFEEKLTEAQSTQKSLESKLRKARKELTEAREAVQAASDTKKSTNNDNNNNDNTKRGASASASPSTKEVEELRAALSAAQAQLQSTDTAAIDAKLEKLQKSHDETLAAALRELESAKAALSRPADGDTAVAQQLRAVLSEDEGTHKLAAAHLHDVYALARDLKAALRAAQSLPLVSLGTDAASARAVMDRIDALDAADATTQTALLAQLQSALTAAQSQRNRLLDALADAPGVPPELREEVRRVGRENAALQQQCVAAQSRAAQASAQSHTFGTDAAMHAARVSAGDGAAVVHVLQQQLDGARGELEEERAKADALCRAREGLQEELKAQRHKAAAAERRTAAVEGEMREMKMGFEQRLAEAAAGEGAVAEMEVRLRERTDQLDQMRGLLEKQKALIVKSNEKSEYFHQKLRETRTEMERMEEGYKSRLQQRDESFQRALNQRLEEYVLEHRTDLSLGEEKLKKLKKKVKKVEAEVDKWKEEYDRKVCECEELRGIMEGQKVEQMRLVRRMGQTEEEAEVYEKKEKIQNALERAKEEQRRKKDLFAMGEVTNNVRRTDF